MKVRKSNRPQKQLLFYWLAEEFQRSRGKKRALDFACGHMLFRPSILATEYVGIDLDSDRIATGLCRYPEVTGIVSNILDAPSELSGDYVVCIETIGVNNYFDVSQTIETVERLISSTEVGGETLFNIGPTAIQFEPRISELLKESYFEVAIYTYGAFDEIRDRRLARLLAKMMRAIPLMRTLGGKKRYLFSCRCKKASS